MELEIMNLKSAFSLNSKDLRRNIMETEKEKLVEVNDEYQNNL
jgi:hypothetical protein